jgi:hypothetical protein
MKNVMQLVTRVVVSIILYCIIGVLIVLAGNIFDFLTDSRGIESSLGLLFYPFIFNLPIILFYVLALYIEPINFSNLRVYNIVAYFISLLVATAIYMPIAFFVVPFLFFPFLGISVLSVVIYVFLAEKFDYAKKGESKQYRNSHLDTRVGKKPKSKPLSADLIARARNDSQISKVEGKSIE